MATCPTCGHDYPAHTRICTRDGTVLEAAAPADVHIGKVLDQKYRLDAQLGQGGMGSLYRATHVMLDKPVAVKLIRTDLVSSPETVRRFQREARAATNLNHPNIVSVYDLGQTDDGTLYIAMELIDGPSLREVIRKGGPLDPSRTVNILRQVGSALSLAHRHQIVHRDLKPQNIMLTIGSDGRELAKLLDFGIAKTFDEVGTQLTMTGLVIGTPQYMAPEQAAGKPVDARSDLYSLGVILYEMLVGDVPFTGDSTPVVLMKHMTEAPIAPSLRFPDRTIPRDLEQMAMRCLEKDPDRRFQSAAEVVTALDAVAPPASGAEAPGAMAADAQAETVVVRRSTRASAAQPSASGSSQRGAAEAPTVPTKRPAAAAVPPSDSSARTGPGRVAARGASEAPDPAIGQPASGVAPAAGSAAPTSRSRMPVVIAGVLVFLLVGVWVAMQFGAFGGASTPVQEASVAGAPVSSQPAPSPTPAAEASPAIAQLPAGGPTAAAPSGPSSAPPPAPAAPPAKATPSSGPAAPTGPGRDRPSATDSPAAAAPAASTPPSATPASSVGARGNATPAGASATTAGQTSAAPASALPENPPVYLQCVGAAEVCGTVRTTVEQALQKAGLSSVRNPERAEIVMKATVSVVDERVDRQFGTTFAVRTYSIDMDAEAVRTSEGVPMPAPRTFSFDSQFGKERLQENARLIADDAVDQVRAYWKKRAR
jgi:serine/threonine-protein kinase